MATKNKQVKQMRAMEAELGMYKQQVDLFKSDIEAANEAMRTLRQRWIAAQRRSRQGGDDDVGAPDSYDILTGPRIPSLPETAAPTVSSGSLSLSKDGEGGGGVADRDDLREDRPQFEASGASAAVVAGA